MKTILILLLESSVAMALFYAVYWFFLRKETFFMINRFFLTGALIFSVILPLFPVHYGVKAGPGTFDLQALASISGDEGSAFDNLSGNGLHDNFLQVLMVLYLTGAGLVFLRLLVQTMQLSFTFSRSSTIRLRDFYIVESQKYTIPFSFLNLIFYNPAIHSREDLEEIIVHEQVHIRERHWVDLLIAELWSVVFWFNPFVWLYERSIKQNHEYLADAGVLAQGRPIGRYQALLINQLMGSPVVAFANHLNFSLNATRFKMMTKKEKPKIRVMRIAWALPVLALLLWAFAEPDFKIHPEAGNDGKGSSPLTVTNPSDIRISGTIVDPDGNPLPGASVILSGTTFGTVTDIDGNFELLIPGNQSATLVFSFVGYITKMVKIDASEKDIRLKTNKMMEAVVEIGASAGKTAPPPPPPPPSSGSKKEQIGKESKAGTSEEYIVQPPSSGTGQETFIIVEEMPMFPGGEKALQQYVTEMEQKLAQAKNIRGKAVVEFTVNGEGKAVNPVIRQQDNESAGAGAVVIINNMQPWKPGKQQGKSVPVKYMLPVEF